MIEDRKQTLSMKTTSAPAANAAAAGKPGKTSGVSPIKPPSVGLTALQVLLYSFCIVHIHSAVQYSKVNAVVKKMKK